MRLNTLTTYFMLVALALCLSMLNIASAQAQTAGGNTIYACYQKDNGQLRKVIGPGQCRNSEIPLNWNITALPGPQGPKGDKGEVGAAGPQGLQGYSIKTFMDDGSTYPKGCGDVGGLVLITVDALGHQVAGTQPQYVCNGAKGETGLQGPQGPQGPEGPAGPQGPSGGGSKVVILRVTASCNVVSTSSPDAFTVLPVIEIIPNPIPGLPPSSSLTGCKVSWPAGTFTGAPGYSVINADVTSATINDDGSGDLTIRADFLSFTDKPWTLLLVR